MTQRFSIIACVFALAVLSGVAQHPASQTVRFQAIEIWVDAGDKPLAAYQIEFKATEAFRTRVKIVGIEGGSTTSVFATPPYYDPAAMQQERVIIAAFSTAKAEMLPTGRTRIATIHVQVIGDVAPRFETNTTALATVEGREIEGIVHKIEAGSKGASRSD